MSPAANQKKSRRRAAAAKGRAAAVKKRAPASPEDGSGAARVAQTREHRTAVRLPVDDPFTSLPATAQKILAAASRLLAESGYSAVTLENVAREAGVNKASIRYNFGNKAGLLMALVDGLIHDECLRMAADLDKVDRKDRLAAAMEGIGGMIVSADSFKGFYEVLPQAFRDRELRERLFILYRWWYGLNLRWLGLPDEIDEDTDYLIVGLAELIAAIPDGLSIQGALDPDNFDVARPLAALELLLRNSMDELSARAAGRGARSAPG
jgi:AcrR family transcriptional regulator